MRASKAKEVKARRYAQSSENSAKPASSRLCAGRCCGVNCFAIKHNGLLHKVRPVTALKLRLVATPLRFASRPCGFAQPPLCLAPLALRASPALTRCSARLALDIHGQCARACGTGTSVSVRRFAHLWCLPPPTLWAWRWRAQAAPVRPVHPPRGFPPPRRLAAWVLVAIAASVPSWVGDGSLAHRGKPQPS